MALLVVLGVHRQFSSGFASVMISVWKCLTSASHRPYVLIVAVGELSYDKPLLDMCFSFKMWI